MGPRFGRCSVAKRKRVCATCDKALTTKDFDTKLVIHSNWTGNYWCPKCTMKLIRQKVA